MQASQRLDRFGAEVFASLNNKLQIGRAHV